MQTRASVKAVTPGHPRENQAGIVQSTDGKTPPKTVNVKWDVDGEVEKMAVADLVQLGEN